MVKTRQQKRIKKDSDSDSSEKSDNSLETESPFSKESDISDDSDKSVEEDEKKNSFIVPDTYVEYEDGRIEHNHRDNDKILNLKMWKNPLSLNSNDNDYKKLADPYDILLDEYDEEDISVADIIKSNLSNKGKLECFKLLFILQNELERWGTTQVYMDRRNDLYKMIKKAQPFTENENEEINRLYKLLKVDETLLHKIVSSKHNENIKMQMLSKYEEIKNLSNNDETRIKYEEWIRTCLSLPSDVVELTTLYKNCNEMLLKVRENLDNKLYGQNTVKERIMEVLTAMWTNPQKSSNCIVFLGNPGVGKTALAKHLADSINLPFYQISFGGSQDSSILKGHSFTYISSKPGEIVQGLIQMGIKNGILFLDELDKIVSSEKGMEVVNTLLHILDYTQNSEFKDNYLHGIPIDLSKLIIIVSINSLNTINSILRDRLPIVKFKDYMIDDKIYIGTDYLVPRVIKNLNMNPTHIKYDTSSIAYILEKSNIDEAGVRQLERNISTIFERINVLIQTNKNKKNKRIKLSYDISKFKLPVVLNKQLIDVLFEEYRNE